jgi:GntR family transcriptional repressor for pyruvate dehydrogenase complex
VVLGRRPVRTRRIQQLEGAKRPVAPDSNSASIGLQPIAPSKRADGVFDQLRLRILSGALELGSQLPNERELAEALGVNRASVREALKRLEFLELIEVRHGQGSFVRAVGGSSALQLIEAILSDRSLVTTELLRQLLEFRRHVTGQVVELAARNHGADQLARARALLERESVAGADPRAALEIDIQMNILLGESTGNLMYQLLCNMFTRLLEHLGPIYFNERRSHARSFETHRRLLDAIEARDPSAAREVLETMLAYSEEAILSEAERLEAEGIIGPRAREAGS